MKATELRIGNYLHSNITGHVFQVFASDIVNINEDLAVAKPIPLTEQWLKDFGFTEVKDKAYHYTLKIPIDGENKNEIVGIIVNNNIVCCAITNGHWSSNNIFHVHQLQNLYFALTGMELTK